MCHWPQESAWADGVGFVSQTYIAWRISEKYGHYFQTPVTEKGVISLTAPENISLLLHA